MIARYPIDSFGIGHAHVASRVRDAGLLQFFAERVSLRLREEKGFAAEIENPVSAGSLFFVQAPCEFLARAAPREILIERQLMPLPIGGERVARNARRNCEPDHLFDIHSRHTLSVGPSELPFNASV